jgi:hypothetical protein
MPRIDANKKLLKDEDDKDPNIYVEQKPPRNEENEFAKMISKLKIDASKTLVKGEGDKDLQNTEKPSRNKKAPESKADDDMRQTHKKMDVKQGKQPCLPAKEDKGTARTRAKKNGITNPNDRHTDKSTPRTRVELVVERGVTPSHTANTDQVSTPTKKKNKSHIYKARRDRKKRDSVSSAALLGTNAATQTII